MAHERSEAGFDWSDSQRRLTESPGARKSRDTLSWLEICSRKDSVKINSSACQFTFGGCLGSTMTRRSPYLLSVLNIGASVLTSHLSRMLSRWVSRIMSRTCNAQWRPRSGWRGGVRSRYSALCLYWLRAWEKSNVIIQSKGFYYVNALDSVTSQKLLWRGYWRE